MVRSHHRVPITRFRSLDGRKRRAHNPEILRSNRSGTTRPRVAQPEERLPSKQEDARSNRRPGHQQSFSS